AAEVQGFAGAVVQRLAGDADDAGATGECGDGIAAVRDGAARFGVGIVVAGDRVGNAFPECLERRGLLAQCALPACGGAFMTGQCNRLMRCGRAAQRLRQLDVLVEQRTDGIGVGGGLVGVACPCGQQQTAPAAYASVTVAAQFQPDAAEAASVVV